ncbi:MAG: N-acetylmuramoyl-L-alanine amidase, partial [Acidobacteriota bacterium]
QAPAPASTATATVRTTAGDHPLNVASPGGQTYFSVEDVMDALGGSVAKDANGFKASYNGNVAAFGPDSRFGVVRDDLIEMPTPPVVIDGHPYVPLQFFQGFVGKVAQVLVTWDATARVLSVRPAQHEVVGVQMSVANVQGISKIVLTLTAAAEYGIVKQQGSYTILFRTAIRAPFTEQAYDDPNVAKAVFTGNELRIQLTAPDVIGDAYKLDDPIRIVLDLRKGATTAPGTMPVTLSRPLDQPGIHTIVIDPGHGGKDVGASGPGGLTEKDATLALCHKLADSIGKKVGARVILTREDDNLVSLDQRPAIANQYHADLFLSVHMNAAVVKGAHGSETYFLSADASDALAQKAADAENAPAKSGVPQPASTDLKLILWDLAQQEYLSESSKLAQTIQEEMNAVTGVQGRGVKQAPFKVLVGATMPAALVEVAFISNPDEEAKLKKEEFQTAVVDAITRAVQRYKTEYETRIGVIRPPATPAAQTPPSTTTAAVKRTGT